MAYSSASWISPAGTSDSDSASFTRVSTARSRSNPTVQFSPQLDQTGDEESRVLPSSSKSQRQWLKSPQIRIDQPTPPVDDDQPRPSGSATRQQRQSTGKRRQQDVEEGPQHVPPPQQGLSEVEEPPPVPPPPDDRNPAQANTVPTDAESERNPPSNFLQNLYTISYLIFFSIWGTLARLGIQWLTFYPGTPIVTPVLWANFGGSMILGFLAEDQRLFRDEWYSFSTVEAEKKEYDEPSEAQLKAERTKQKKVIPLYVGLATGFCGSFTSFSSFSRDIFLALSNDLPTPLNHPYPQNAKLPSTSLTQPRNGGYSFLAFIAVIVYTIALSLGGLILGAHIAAELYHWTPRVPKKLTRKFLDPLFVNLGFGCWIGALFLAIFPPDRPGGPASRGSWANETWRGEALFAIVLAPVGCLLRWYISLTMNSLVPSFPLGTFAVNMFGTAVEAMCFDIQHVGVGVMGQVGGGQVGCQVLQGVQDGFCGCLTTVSTWVAEINGLKRRHGYGYAFCSVLGALCLTVVITGSVRWSVGWSDPVCSTGYTSKLY